MTKLRCPHCKRFYALDKGGGIRLHIAPGNTWSCPRVHESDLPNGGDRECSGRRGTNRGSYGPYQVGEMVYTLTRSYGDGRGGCGLLYGIVVKAGPKTWDVLWESDTRARYRQDYEVIQYADASAFGHDAEYETKIRNKLRAAAGLTKEG